MKTKLFSHIRIAVMAILAALGCAGCSNFLICAKPPETPPDGHKGTPQLNFNGKKKGIFIPVYREYPISSPTVIASPALRAVRVPDTTFRCAIENGFFFKCASSRRALKAEPEDYACLPVSTAETALLLEQGFTATFGGPTPPPEEPKQETKGASSNALNLDLSFLIEKERLSAGSDRSTTIIYYPVESTHQEPPFPWWLLSSAGSSCASCEGAFSRTIDVNHHIAAGGFPERIELVPTGSLSAVLNANVGAQVSGTVQAQVSGTVHAEAKGSIESESKETGDRDTKNIYMTGPGVPPASISVKDDPLEVQSFEVVLDSKKEAREIRVEFRGNLAQLSTVKIRQVSHGKDCKISTQLKKSNLNSTDEADTHCGENSGNICSEIHALRSESHVLIGTFKGESVGEVLIDGVEFLAAEGIKCTGREVEGKKRKICKTSVIIDLNPTCSSPPGQPASPAPQKIAAAPPGSPTAR